MNIEELYRLFKESSGITTDSRKVSSNSIYFALRGERFDGNKFAISSIESGAKLAVIDDPKIKESESIIFVPDALATLQELATYARSKWTFPVIAIAGSNGKTTTKELLSAVLKSKYKVFSTPGNFNNHIGVPLTLLMVPDDTEMLILELGANHLKEHEFLCGIAKPDYGIITNNGKDHLEGYGSLDNVKKSNAELYDYLRSTSGMAFVDADNPELMKMSEGLNRHTYGFEADGSIKAKRASRGIYAAIQTESGIDISSSLAGKFNEINILTAFAIGSYFGVEVLDIKEAITNYQPKLNRSQLVTYRNYEILLDAYNSNPSSVKLALSSLKESNNPKQMVILGGMLELGSFEKDEHEDLLEHVKSMNLEKIWLIGKEFDFAKNDKDVTWFQSTDDCKVSFEKLDFSSGIMLLKGSRKYELEKLIGNTN
jgi:UDP-N-acetylmuramoyl-tripeptide--D-alanyl-D-alanine ligase